MYPICVYVYRAYGLQFTTKYPGKVHTILPSDTYAKSKASKNKKGIISGQRTVKSYEQAASECKHAVEKIAKECRRINHRYRDPHFDIEWDLKRGYRDCLDGLIPSEDSPQPKSVKRVPVRLSLLLLNSVKTSIAANTGLGHF